MKSIFSLSLAACLALVYVSQADADDLSDALETIRAVESKGKGNREAAVAWEVVAKSDATALPTILSALDDANPLAANWLRGAVESVADRSLTETGKLPAKELEEFILETKHDPRGRRLAYEWLLKVDATASDRLIPGMLNDPSVEFRRDAVQRLLDKAIALKADEKNDAAKEVFLKALAGARDDDQVKEIIEPLAALGHKVDLPRHFGFIMDWHLAGPFDNTDKKGFAAVYPPEQEVDLGATYTGQKGDVKWTKHVTSDDYGIVDIAKATEPFKGAVTYAFSEFTSEKDQEVDVRLGTPNAYKVWVNGELIFGRDEYHRGMALDQYQFRATLKKGKNEILIKVCQNEQTDNWAQRWQFQLRVCDSAGTAVLSTTRPDPLETAQLSK